MKKKIIIFGMISLTCISGICGCSGNKIESMKNYEKGMSKDLETETDRVIDVDETLALYQFMQENEGYPYVLSELAASFLEENSELFPTELSAELDKYVDKSVDYKHLNKNIDKYGQTLFYDESMYVLDIHEEDTGNGFYLTTVHVVDDDGNSFVIFYKGELPDVFKDDTVSVYGLPLGLSSFENVGGGSTIAVILAGCRIDNSIDYVSSYQSVIEQVANNSAYYSDVDYAVYDIDNDGVMELLIDSGEELLAYTMKNNELISLGSVYMPTYGTFFKAEDGNGIYIVEGRMGCETVYRLTKSENYVNLYEEWSIGTCCLDVGYYENSHPVKQFDVGDYSALENPPMMSSEPVTVDESLSYIFRKSSSQYLQKSDLIGLSAFECKIARNEIFARYARMFADAELQAYFDAKEWYIGCVSPEAFDESVLNEFERANLDLIVQYEIEQGYR